MRNISKLKVQNSKLRNCFDKLSKYFKKSFKFLVVILTFNICVLSFLCALPYIQNPTLGQYADFSFSFVVSDPEAADGDIMISSDNGLVRANTISSNRLFGVLQTNTLIVLRTTDENSKPIATSGTALVNVTTLAGTIKTGDYITSSTIPGKGQKLIGSGYVIGVAQANFDGSGGDTVTADNQQVASGQIPVAVKVDYAEITNPQNLNRFLSAFNNALLNNVSSPEQLFQAVRYIAAGAIMFISFMVGFFTFSRAIPKGIEAIGRNPLAKNSIYLSIIMNIIFTVLTTAIGVIASVIILRL